MRNLEDKGVNYLHINFDRGISLPKHKPIEHKCTPRVPGHKPTALSGYAEIVEELNITIAITARAPGTLTFGR